MKRIILLVLCVLLLALPSYGATYNIGEDYSSLQEAFETADSDEDTAPVFNFTESYAADSAITINGTAYHEEVDGSENDFDLSDYSTSFSSIRFTGKYTSGSGARHFILTAPSLPITFSSMTFTGSSGGGVQINSGTVTFTGSNTFTGNTSSGNGGALYIAGGTVTLDGTNSFTSNTAANGGAIYIAGGTVTFSAAPTFESNTATTNGGAIYIESGTVTLPNGQAFTSNTAVNGGAIYNAGTLTFSGTSTFTSNNASTSGGAIYSAGQITFTGAPTFKTNGTTSTTNGGAIYAASGANITFSAAPTLSGNLAENGGVFYVDGGAVSFGNYSVTFTGDTTSVTNGGLFYVDSGRVEFAGASTFTKHIAAANGGVFYVAGGNVIFTGAAVFSTNGLTSATTGGAIYNAGGTITFSSTAEFSGNTANNGGAIALSGSAVMPTFSSTVKFTSNSASNNGGAVWSSSADITPTSAYTFSSNTATESGGAIYSESGTITISGLSIDVVNTATNGGGGFAATNSGTIDVYDSIIKNQVAIAGGALCGRNIIIESSDFESNTSNATATTTAGGGAICVSQDSGTLRMSYARFIKNKSSLHGGAILSRGEVTLAQNVYFEENSATSNTSNGGAMYLPGDADKNLVNITCYNNTAKGVGGAIWASGQVNIRKSYFLENNSTSHGGAIYYDQRGGNNDFTIEQSMATGNYTSSGSGGVIYVQADNINIRQSTFNANQSVRGEGGSVYMRALTNGMVENCTFTDSQAATNGGGLAIYGTNTIRSCAFILNNIATNQGGGVYVGSGATVTVIANLFVGNAATIGSDVYKEGSIASTGYNRVGTYGEGGNNTSWIDNTGDSKKTDREDSTWTTSTFYGSNTLSENARSDSIPPYIGYNEEYRLLTVALAEVDINEEDRAINIIPYDQRILLPQYDERGYNRHVGVALDIGPVFFDGTRPDGGDDEITSYTISSVKMSGIPNTLKSPGQTANLSAIILYTNGLSAYGGSRSGEEPVTWSSSNRNVVRVSNNGVVTAWRTPGTAYITVSTVRGGSNGSPAADTQAIIVDFQATSMNLSDAFIDNLLNFNQGDLYEHDMSVGIANVNASTLSSSSFISAFYSNWSYEPALIDTLDSSALFSSQSTYNMTVSTAANETFNKPGVKFSYSGIEAGELLPINYSWAFDGTQLQTIFGYNFADKNIDSTLVNDIFKVLQIDFAGDSQAWHVLPSSSVTASDAYSSGALALTKTDNGNGIRIDLTVYLANVSGNVRLVNNLLVLPDGVVDSQLNGTMWITRNTSGSGGSGGSGGGTDTDPLIPVSSGGGGGGGCNSLGLGLLAAALMFALRRK